MINNIVYNTNIYILGLNAKILELYNKRDKESRGTHIPRLFIRFTIMLAHSFPSELDQENLAGRVNTMKFTIIFFLSLLPSPHGLSAGTYLYCQYF